MMSLFKTLRMMGFLSNDTFNKFEGFKEYVVDLDDMKLEAE